MRVTQVTILLFVLASASACTLQPLNNTFPPDLNSVDFSGFGWRPNQTVEIQGFDTRTNNWVTIRTVQTASDVGLFWAGTNWYAYEAQNVNVDNPNGLCIFGNWSTFSMSCVISAGSQDGRFRVLADGVTFFSFDQGFQGCIGNELNAGSTQRQATINCQSANSPVIVLRKLT
jgi:hypothetical protein